MSGNVRRHQIRLFYLLDRVNDENSNRRDSGLKLPSVTSLENIHWVVQVIRRRSIVLSMNRSRREREKWWSSTHWTLQWDTISLHLRRYSSANHWHSSSDWFVRLDTLDILSDQWKCSFSPSPSPSLYLCLYSSSSFVAIVILDNRQITIQPWAIKHTRCITK